VSPTRDEHITHRHSTNTTTVRVTKRRLNPPHQQPRQPLRRRRSNPHPPPLRSHCNDTNLTSNHETPFMQNEKEKTLSKIDVEGSSRDGAASGVAELGLTLKFFILYLFSQWGI